ncbi:P-loop containing nucleoside triphosphate hydrolase protein [Powellomyces hirtus]|nr:P-loop containing nucleoside triphosphate hydrolase protein [Powellomyces hirtus]
MAHDILKVVLLGDGSVGKTSFRNQFVHRRFAPHYKATIGADFVSKTVETPDGRSVAMQLWDTAGQERFQSLGVAFYRGTDVCILVYDVTSPASALNLVRWIRDFIRISGLTRDEAAHFPFVLVANKIDAGHARAVSKKQGQELAGYLKRVCCGEVSVGDVWKWGAGDSQQRQPQQQQQQRQGLRKRVSVARAKEQGQQQHQQQQPHYQQQQQQQTQTPAGRSTRLFGVARGPVPHASPSSPLLTRTNSNSNDHHKPPRSPALRPLGPTHSRWSLSLHPPRDTLPPTTHTGSSGSGSITPHRRPPSIAASQSNWRDSMTSRYSSYETASEFSDDEQDGTVIPQQQQQQQQQAAYHQEQEPTAADPVSPDGTSSTDEPATSESESDSESGSELDSDHDANPTDDENETETGPPHHIHTDSASETDDGASSIISSSAFSSTSSYQNAPPPPPPPSPPPTSQPPLPSPPLDTSTTTSTTTLPLFEVSAKTATRVDDVFAYIAKSVSSPTYAFHIHDHHHQEGRDPDTLLLLLRTNSNTHRKTITVGGGGKASKRGTSFSSCAC